MIKPRVIILSGYGLNCEEETALGFKLAGSVVQIVHINDLAEGIKKLGNYEIMAIPGGFSYGDDTGSGKAYANKLNNNLKDEINEFVSKDKLAIGICNGFQILTQTGLVPGALTVNDGARYLDRWVDLEITGESPWTRGIKKLSLPIAHGEGKYFAQKKVLSGLNKSLGLAARYIKGEICQYQNLPANPNGSIMDIAAVSAYNGRVLGIMPHPERGMFFHHLPNWPLKKEKLIREGKPLPEYGPGFQIFKNAVRYFN
ncbi:MAG: phosphoribosylformylglycinamidine synthase subunit PurQ [Patescibacteria group bacterium]|jgi:phosphoribosylformylglycinamidine synthase